MMREPKSYDAKVKGASSTIASPCFGFPTWKNSLQTNTLSEYVGKYATKDAADEAGEDSESDDEMSSVGSYNSDGEEEEDDEVAGNMEEL